MKLLEYESKKILAGYGIPIPRGGLAANVTEACRIAQNLKPPLAVKAQVPVAGRGKAGGIIFAESFLEVENAAKKLFTMRIGGLPVQYLWIEEKIQAEKELYFGMTIDRVNKTYVMIGSTEGGVDIEEVAEKSPEKVLKFLVDPIQGFRLYHARQIAKSMGYSGNKLLSLANIFYSLYRAGLEYDAELIEMNPLVETPEGNFVAVDARIIIDDNAVFRHPEFKERALSGELSQLEVEAIKSNLAYVKLDGDIGVIGNGAGLVMATLDAIQLYGGKPANFLDVGGGASSEKIAAALRILLLDPNVKAILVNILGGITRCDEVAKGILQAKEKLGVKKPMVIRLVGTNEEEGRRILTEAGIHVLDSMEEAARQIVKMIREL
jgi:succinyl-CoA synthetase beta subunit